jgi:hypothetical protein
MVRGETPWASTPWTSRLIVDDPWGFALDIQEELEKSKKKVAA